MTDKELLKLFNNQYPYPSCMEINEAINPIKAREVWNKMAEKGFVKITYTARCGFEALTGEFVTLTKQGLEYINTNTYTN
jgi:hypothetical protein